MSLHLTKYNGWWCLGQSDRSNFVLATSLLDCGVARAWLARAQDAFVIGHDNAFLQPAELSKGPTDEI